MRSVVYKAEEDEDEAVDREKDRERERERVIGGESQAENRPTSFLTITTTTTTTLCCTTTTMDYRIHCAFYI